MGGEILTRFTIWITLAGYAFGAGAYALARGRRRWDHAARTAWSVACVALVAHVLSAFHFQHAWSQEAAYRDTARQTNALFGLDWGGGLYVNYALAALWVADLLWWWLGGLDAYRRRPLWLAAAWHAFLFFIVFNATVVFARGPVRWVGLCICLGLCLAWWLAGRDAATRKEQTKEQTATGR